MTPIFPVEKFNPSSPAVRREVRRVVGSPTSTRINISRSREVLVLDGVDGMGSLQPPLPQIPCPEHRPHVTSAVQCKLPAHFLPHNEEFSSSVLCRAMLPVSIGDWPGDWRSDTTRCAAKIGSLPMASEEAAVVPIIVCASLTSAPLETETISIPC